MNKFIKFLMGFGFTLGAVGVLVAIGTVLSLLAQLIGDYLMVGAAFVYLAMMILTLAVGMGISYANHEESEEK